MDKEDFETRELLKEYATVLRLAEILIKSMASTAKVEERRVLSEIGRMQIRTDILLRK